MIIQRKKSIIIVVVILIFILPTPTLPRTDKWQTLETEHFIIHYTNERKQAVLLQRVSENFYQRATDMLGTITGKIDIWLISGRDFRATAPIQDWAVGYAYPLKRRIVIKDPSFFENSKLELARVVKHEIVHIIFGARIGEGMKNAPLWFNEGIAMYGSEEWSYSHYWLMLTNVFSKSIIPLNKLSSQFPKEKRLAQLAYAEGFSAVSMIARESGDEKLREITDLLAMGEDM
ncbi:MAG: peptidase MA family metallohydrolase, partial [Candidatus Poribacteria bacterium]